MRFFNLINFQNIFIIKSDIPSLFLLIYKKSLLFYLLLQNNFILIQLR